MPDLDYPLPVRLVHRGGATRLATVKDWLRGNTQAGRAQMRFDLGGLAGICTFSLSHGWGSKPVDDWYIHPADLAKLVEWAYEKEGREIHVTPRSPGRAVRPKRGRKAHPKQSSMFD